MNDSNLNVGIITTADASVASFRLRNLVAQRALSNCLIPVDLCKFASPHHTVLLFSKHFRYYEQKIAEQAKKMGIKIVFDICDWHPEGTAHYNHYKTMLRLADQITVNTSVMQKLVLINHNRGSYLIEDPWETLEKPVRIKTKTPKLVWFGHPRNFDPLRNLIRLGLPYSLDILSLFMREANMYDNPMLHCIPWSEERQELALEQCDIVIIPAGNSLEWQVKSANRFVTALRAGRFVVANRLPAYEEFEGFGWIGDDILEGIDWVCRNPDEATVRVMKGQDYIREIYDPAEVGKKWVRLFKEA